MEEYLVIHEAEPKKTDEAPTVEKTMITLFETTAGELKVEEETEVVV